MFIRWKRRERVSRKASKRRGSALTGRFLLSAVLVRSERQDGRVRQKVVAYLGSIAEERVKDVWPRRRLWEAAAPRLDSLGLGPAERQKVEAALHARVERPTAEEVEASDRERAQWEAGLVALVGMCRRRRRGRR